MNEYTIYCTEEQTKKALNLDAPIEVTTIDSGNPFEPNYGVVAPTAEQMIGWLRKEMKLAISIDYNIQNNKPVWFYSIFNFAYSNPFSEPEEATLAAIDAALDYLVDNNLIK